MMLRRALLLSGGLLMTATATHRLLAWLKRKRPWSGMKDVVSYSSRMIAAQRGLENLRPDRLFVDNLSQVLAGGAWEAAQERLKLRQQQVAAAEAAAPGSTSSKNFRSIAIRTRYFDDAIQDALKKDSKVRQVVMLGAGMDTRPWRIELPPGVSWFEVDRPYVMLAKEQELVSAGAQISKAHSDERGESNHPLRPQSWTPVSADLAHQPLADTLRCAGFDPQCPTVWVAEGLLMYLDASDVKSLFSQVAQLSVAGSSALFSMVSEGAVSHAQKNGSALTSTWLWGLPEGDEGKQFFLGCGWSTRRLDQIGTANASYGCYTATPDPPGTPGSRRILYWQGQLAS